MFQDLRENISWMKKCAGWRWIIPIIAVSFLCHIIADFICLLDWRKEKKLYKAYRKQQRASG